jgi:CheY-like chemotaxis protein/anti-sigma regulatory factor (Ser/Thr protein kinase)
VRIRQILANLVSNAIKFTHQGHVRVTVEQIFRDDAGTLLRLAVTDTGIGVPQDQIDRIFDKFTQADSTTTRRYGGTGLGLAICTQLVELMNGNIEARSKVGEGTTIVVTLNLPVADRVDEIDDDLGRAASRRAAPLKAHVLVVEDNIVNQELAATLLRNMGCTVDVADDCLAAISMTANQYYDVIFMDCQMPEMDGYAATRAIRSTESQSDCHTPIIALTASAMSGDREKCLDAGMDDYITKPILHEDLLAVVE